MLTKICTQVLIFNLCWHKTNQYNGFLFSEISDHVVWLSVVLLVGLFGFQRCGTSKVSLSFSPIMLMWFATNVCIGVYNIIVYHPCVLKAISPHYFLYFFLNNPNTAWQLLGAVFLGITGMYVYTLLSLYIFLHHKLLLH